MATWDYIQKQILLGDASSGKSSLLVRLTDDRFLTHSEPTVGVEFGSRIVELKPRSRLGDAQHDSSTGKPTGTAVRVDADANADKGDELDRQAVGKKVKLQIWDTAGQESFRSITRSYYRGAGGALLIFDLTSRPTFTSLPTWLADLRAWGEEGLAILLVGNKADLVQSQSESESESANGNEEAARQITSEEARQWASENGLVGYVESSAKSGAGVEAAFDTLTREVWRRGERQKKLKRGGGGGAVAGDGGGSGGFSLSGVMGAGGKYGAAGKGCC